MKNFGGGGLHKLMQQANQMQNKMKKVKEELNEKEFEAGAGGDAVKVRINGAMKILSVTIKPDVMTAGDIEMLQDLVLTATNEAIKIARETTEGEMSKITGGMNMPGLY
ncbi:MAG: nucleoid-associated protein, YbaB/EbfC family [Bdellovibrionales bacterium RBG_16_40_8]|nr:MAG: nucleoid-associated protein, YbaB/EbfC family [Bdellovibrionales bacterium RBG_16_40_8]